MDCLRGYMKGKRINRYIMECKSTTAAKKETAKKGINRYIMECKFD